MRLTDANLYLTRRGLPPQLEIECAGNCTNRFALVDGLAWPAKPPDAETPVMIFFCEGLGKNARPLVKGSSQPYFERHV